MTTSDVGPATSLAGKRHLLQVGSRAERLADLLRSEILEGEHRPGTQLGEERLVKDVGFSRNTVREALQRLAHERLVVHRHHRGVFVRKLRIDDLDALCGLRRSLEVGAVREAAGRGVDPGGHLVAEVRDAARAGRRAAADQDWGAAGTANARLHLALAALAGNDRIDEALRSVTAEMRLAFLLVPDARALHEPYVEANGTLAEHAVAGRWTELTEELDRYLRESQDHLVGIYRVAVSPDDEQEPDR